MEKEIKTMSKVTMVARVCIIKRLTKNIGTEDLGYVVVRHDNLKLETIKKDMLIHLLQNRAIECTNLQLTSDGKDIRFSNGVKDRYTIIDYRNNKPIKISYTIICRIENKFNLIGYAVSNGIDEKTKVLKVSEAVQKQIDGEISNGKLRDTYEGRIVSSIEGEYEVLEKSFLFGKVRRKCEEVMSKRLNEFELNILSIGTFTYDKDSYIGLKPRRYAYVIIRCTDKKEIILTKSLAIDISKDNSEIIHEATVQSHKDEINEILKMSEDEGSMNICGAIHLDKLKELLDQGINLKVDDFPEITLIGMNVDKSEIVEKSTSLNLNKTNSKERLSVSNFDKIVGKTVEDSVRELNMMANNIREDESSPANEALAQSCECLRIVLDKCLN